MNTPFNKNMKMITAFLPNGKGYDLLKFLHEKGHTTANTHNARGSFIGGPSDKTGQPLEEQKEILTCIVDADKADKIFAELHLEAEFDKPGTGFMFMENLSFASTYVLPDVGS